MLRFRPLRLSPSLPLYVFLMLLSTVATPLPAQERQTDPETTDDLRAIEDKVAAVVKKALPATVAINAQGTFGSGVIVSADGYILTAGHVSTEPGRRVKVILNGERTVYAKTLGWGQVEDLGLLKIVGDQEWPFLEMGSSADLKRGDWCVSMGHPGGHERGRAAVVRTGRVLSTAWRQLRTDCTIASGDSGGPLLDLKGRVIGIHSRINPDLSRNYHVPIDKFHQSWTRLTSAETWGQSLIGVRGVDDAAGYRITEVIEGFPAQRAGLKPGDIITKIDDEEVTDFDTLAREVTRRSAGTKVELLIQRDKKLLTIEVEVANRGEAR